MDEIALSIGYAVMALGGVALTAILVIGATKLSNRASHAVVDCYRGWKTFLEFREWYHSQRGEQKQ